MDPNATAASPDRRARRVPLPLAYRPPAIGVLTAVTGAAVLALGLLSAFYVEPEVFGSVLAGYDPPFDGIAGLLLLAVSLRIRDRSSVAWMFALLAPALTIFIAIFSPNLYSIGSAGATSLLVAVVFPYRAGFYRGSATGQRATELMVVVTALLSLLFGMVGSRWLGSQFTPPVTDWTNALYFTVTTISTNGSNYLPLTDAARDFTVVLILLGVGTFLSAVVVLFLPFLERRLEQVAARLERAQMEELSDHVIVCGHGGEARASADALRESSVRAVLLSTDGPAIERLRAEGYRAHHGDPSNEADLTAVGIGRARALVAAQETDAENLLTVITARGIRASLRIVAVATSPASVPKLERAGANRTISLVRVAGQLVTQAALEPPRPGPGPRPTVGR